MAKQIVFNPAVGCISTWAINFQNNVLQFGDLEGRVLL